MSIILAIIGVLLLFGLLMMAIAAVAFWILGIVSIFVFVTAGFAVTALFNTGQDGFLLGGLVAVLILWGVLAYKGNQLDEDGKGR